MHYTGGIYKHHEDPKSKVLGSHAVRVIGWGVGRDTPYWLVANTWGRNWGEDGYVKFAMN